MGTDTRIPVEVETPRVPNFIRIKGHGGSVSVGDIPDDQLREIGAAWTEKLLARAAEQRQSG